MTKSTDTQELELKILLAHLPIEADVVERLEIYISAKYISKDKLLKAIPEKWTAEKIMSTAKAELSIASGFNQAIDQTLEALGLGEVQNG